MDHPRHDILAAKSGTTPERIIGIALVVLFHVGLIYAIATGLAMRVVKQVPTVITAQVMPPEKPKETPPPPPPELQLPQLPSVPPPDVTIQQQRAITPPITTTSQPPRAITPPAPPAPPVAPTSATGIASTHTIPPYPEMARRLAQVGKVLLKLSIGADGAVTNAQVEQSSGVNDLDAAAVNWVKAHWRYKPATQNGKPVVSATEAEVVFNLKNAR